MSGNRLCSVPQCTNVKTENNSFHLFPKDDELKKTWLKVLKMRCATASMKVCSDHFTRDNFYFPEYNTVRKKLKLGSIPSRKIPTTTIAKRVSNSVIARARNERSRKRMQWKEKINFIANNSQSAVKANEGEVTALGANKKARFTALSTRDDDVTETSSEDESSESSDQSDVKSYVEQSPHEVAAKTVWLDRKKVQCTQTSPRIEKTIVASFLREEGQLTDLTGIGSFELLEKIAKSMETVETMTKCNHRFVLAARERIILTFTKLRTNMTFVCLAALFNISQGACYKYFCYTIVSLRDVTLGLIKWPEKQETVQNMPQCFENFASTRVIVDRIEVPIGMTRFTSSRIHDRARRCGDKNIIKYLIGAVPSGAVCFLSPPYGDRVPDDELLVHSGILERLSENDIIITNRDFNVHEELQARGVQLINPTLLLNENLMSSGEASETLALKFHVERVIQRVRVFKILRSSVPRSLLTHLDSIITVVCGLVNLTSSLANDEFL